MNLCNACAGLNIEKLFSAVYNTQHTILHASLKLLEDAAKHGCENCQTFERCFNDHLVDLKEQVARVGRTIGMTPPVVVFLQTAFPQNGERPIIKFHVQIGDGPEKPGVQPLKISFRVSQSWELSQIKKGAPFTFRYTEIDHDLGSNQNFDIAHKWIRTCCNEHKPGICPALIDVELPTRLIDVGTPDGKESMRLIETSKDQKSRYLALSHCWGPPGTKKLLTTNETLSARLLSIDQTEMPPNFSDAVTITRRLGYSYLWIDSLCIIQDSKSDWETESQNMGRIYTNAALTLAAAAATSSDGGMLTKVYQAVSSEKLSPKNWFLTDSIGRSHTAFLQNNSPPEYNETKAEFPPCRIKLDQHDEERNIILEPMAEFSDLEENWYRCTVLGPLALRGWCLQEKLLSRRILYYGNRQIYWQCASARKAADGEDVPASAARSVASLGNEVSDWPDILSLRQLHEEAITSGSEEKRRAIETKIYKTWHNVIFLYINRRLTFNSDRLPGLAGMATLIHEITSDRYVAGFWLKYLSTSLIWTPMNTRLTEDTPRFIAERYEIEKPEWDKEDSQLSGPSWSWCSANIQDLLNFWADFDELYRERFWKGQDVQVVDVKVELVGNNPFGQVKSGELLLRGYTYSRWDVRCLDPGGWRTFSILILGFCPHSPWNRENGNDSGSEDQSVLWDYWPRQEMSPARRMWKHIFQWLLDLLTILLWQGLTGFHRHRGRMGCGGCKEYSCMHILSILDKAPGKDGRREVDLWSLILEPVPGEAERYRRVGIARKVAYVTEDEVLDGKVVDDRRIPKVFQGWKHREVVVI